MHTDFSAVQYSITVLGHRKFVRGNNMVLEYVVDG